MVIGRGACVPATLGRIALTFSDQEVMMRFWAPGDTSQGALYGTGYAQATDGTVRLSGTPNSAAGHLRGDTLTLDVAGGYLCGRRILAALVRTTS
jgi:hypothetical protein